MGGTREQLQWDADDALVHRYTGPPDLDFIIQRTTGGSGEKILDEFNQSTLDKVGEFTFSGIVAHTA
jgi:hypothetical protein